MTCKDCIHNDLCFDNGTHFIRYVKGEDKENAETKCPFKHFKNKADFVEVVRCKDCKYSEVTDNGRFHNKIYCFQPAPIKQIVETEEERFCSYGKRKE